jgi:hypothetical protein
VLGTAEERADFVTTTIDDCDFVRTSTGGTMLSFYTDSTNVIQDSRFTTEDSANDANVHNGTPNNASVRFVDCTMDNNNLSAGTGIGYVCRVSDEVSPISDPRSLTLERCTVTGAWLSAVSIDTDATAQEIILIDNDFSGIDRARAVTFSSTYLGTLTGSGNLFNDGAGANFRPFHVIAGNPGIHTVQQKRALDATTRVAATTLSVPISKDAFDVSGTTTIVNLNLGLSANTDMERYFHNATFVMRRTAAGAYSDTGNIVPLTTATRSVGDIAHFRVNITPASGTSVTVQFIEFLPVLSAAVTDSLADETGADTGSVLFSRTGSPTLALTASVDITGTATNGVDYTTITTPLEFTAGSASVSKTVEGIPDLLFDEDTETVIFTVTPSASYVVSGDPAIVYIVATAAPQVAVVATTAETSEGGAPGVFTISRSGSTAADLTVDVSIGGTATPGSDYTALETSVVIPAGESSIEVEVVALVDLDLESSETVILTVLDGVTYDVLGDPATITIIDTTIIPPTPEPHFSHYEGRLLAPEEVEALLEGGLTHGDQTMLLFYDSDTSLEFDDDE